MNEGHESLIMLLLSSLDVFYPFHTFKVNHLKQNQVTEWGLLIGQSEEPNAFHWLKFKLVRQSWINCVSVNEVLGSQKSSVDENCSKEINRTIFNLIQTKYLCNMTN